jgi:hypothetical protein
MQGPRRLIVAMLGVITVTTALAVGGPVRASGTEAGVTFKAYTAPEGFANAHLAGETSIGVVKGTTDALMQMRYTTARISWDDAVYPSAASWSNVTSPNARATYDSSLWTDRVTGRTFVALLLAGAMTLYTDDGGTTWMTPLPPIIQPLDKEFIGGGPHAVNAANPAYQHATYYCLGLLLAQCARSDDGGNTWGAPVTIPLVECSEVHGRVVVDQNGSVYIPRHRCGSRQGMVVSRDEGATWTEIAVPGTLATTEEDRRDPMMAFDAGGRMYFATSSAGRPVITTSPDGGASWSPAVDVGGQFAIRNTEFPLVAAGDAGRAAFAFFGTPTPGDDQSTDFTGMWHVYVSSTFDGGATWETVDATPSDPVQRGCIFEGGGNPRLPDNDLTGAAPLTREGRPHESLDNPCWNLRDFQDMTVDEEGRVLVSYADGCTTAVCVAPEGTPADSTDSLATISRQASGPRLFAAFDPIGSRPLLPTESGPNGTTLEARIGMPAGPTGGTTPRVAVTSTRSPAPQSVRRWRRRRPPPGPFSSRRLP